MGDVRDCEEHNIAASIKSISEHLDDFPRAAFQDLVIDEAHHAAAKTYKQVLGYCRPRFVLGLTATPMKKGTGPFELAGSLEPAWKGPVPFFIGHRTGRTGSRSWRSFGTVSTGRSLREAVERGSRHADLVVDTTARGGKASSPGPGIHVGLNPRC
jgi:hypothetical protein